ncbi:MAG: type II secretion system F family protein [Nocardioidaceae bacterium]
MTLTAALLAALAVSLWLPLPARPPRLRGARPVRRLAPVALLATTGLLLPALLDGTRLALGLVVLGCAAGAADVVRRGRVVRAADRRRAAVVEAAEALAAELTAGQPVGRALERTVEVWPEFARVDAAARLGADVPTALREVAHRPGAEALVDVATAWQVSHDSGAGLATALGQVAATARARQATRHVVAAELASARATAQMVALLPVGVLAMAAGVGGSPWHFLLATPAGLVCLATGAGLAFAGLRWIDRIAAAVLR